MRFITYVGDSPSLRTAPRRRVYEFEQHKTIPIGFRPEEVNPKDASILARKVTGKGEFLFLLES